MGAPQGGEGWHAHPRGPLSGGPAAARIRVDEGDGGEDFRRQGVGAHGVRHEPARAVQGILGGQPSFSGDPLREPVMWYSAFWSGIHPNIALSFLQYFTTFQ